MGMSGEALQAAAYYRYARFEATQHGAPDLFLNNGHDVFFAHHHELVTVKVDGDELMVMREEDIMAVVQK